MTTLLIANTPPFQLCMLSVNINHVKIEEFSARDTGIAEGMRTL